ncbi:thioredoxin domain protein [Campylobacter iguaniorum]|uniref:thioredoxin family protein n=1 Tax=Campylobacter iguaniorum TaxID=1244531 RepID=UPI00073A3212|nr:thioredoxin family protein [Campylobacter iguaniorum]ALV25007.1 thioredoxin domain protein [Campylobacter iguaniorum]ANE36270.1 thioredoxin domain protein [Campylobacter iguaniorum]
MKIEILGTGCAKCKAMYEVAQKAVAKIGGFHEIKKIEDISLIMEYGVMSTPALVVDGVVKSSGKLLSVDEMMGLLQSE